MFNESSLITYYALTPIHTGAGSSVSYIDLPVQRERHTSFPMMAGSGLKGVFRALAKRNWDNDDKINKIFGPENGSEASSCIAFTDAKILLYPVRSVKNIFAWITCPYILNRLKEDLASAGKNIDNFSIPELADDSKIIIYSDSKLKIDNSNVGLEEFVFNVMNSQISLDNIINKIKEFIPATDTTNNLCKRFAVVSDNVFADLVNYAVEVRTRIQIDQTTGTAQNKALFTIEMVPSESVFYNLIFVSDQKFKSGDQEKNSNDNKSKDNKKVLEMVEELVNNNQVIQVGGDETIGNGFVKLKFSKIK
ncbi:MAG: type III-B CRISPR module RAMP protein Cmr4 [Spirochaetales bacterium]|nr:type III-B CRISPR module RAMP protein Cmr4 [Exilispira sp.]NMC68420.1 type III-B CRISPR module RAMP protein Cmr4 [Spirochaetales bacterium]